MHRAAYHAVGARQNPWDRVLESSASPLQNTGLPRRHAMTDEGGDKPHPYINRDCFGCASQ